MNLVILTKTKSGKYTRVVLNVRKNSEFTLIENIDNLSYPR